MLFPFGFVFGKSIEHQLIHSGHSVPIFTEMVCEYSTFKLWSVHVPLFLYQFAVNKHPQILDLVYHVYKTFTIVITTPVLF